MKMRRVTIEYTTCKRCGMPLATASRSIYGLDNLKKRLGGICSKCITESERQEIENGIVGAVTGRTNG